jgi:hypothetical protein
MKLFSQGLGKKEVIRLTDIKNLKEDQLLGRILNELRIEGLGEVYVQTTDDVDFLDIANSILHFLDLNQLKIGSLNTDQYERLIVICIDEICEHIPLLDGVEEEQITRIVNLLRNTKIIRTWFEKFFSCCFHG